MLKSYICTQSAGFRLYGSKIKIPFFGLSYLQSCFSAQGSSCFKLTNNVIRPPSSSAAAASRKQNLSAWVGALTLIGCAILGSNSIVANTSGCSSRETRIGSGKTNRREFCSWMVSVSSWAYLDSWGLGFRGTRAVGFGLCSNELAFSSS